jgi:hypothetical protein
MPVFYHGAIRHFARAMIGPPRAIDVGLGGGELGRGFYTQSSIGNAMRWASGRSPQNAVVISVSLQDAAYNLLSKQILKGKQVRRWNYRLRQTHNENIHVFNCDVVVGPIISKPHIEQQKFESPNAQAALNGPLTMLVMIP